MIPGVPPKRSAERRRRNKTTESGLPIEAEIVEISDKIIEDAEPVNPGIDPNETWHEVARLQWDSALRSGQRIFYEPTDWAQLYMLCEELSLEMSEKVIGFSEKDGQLVYAVQPIPGGKMTALMKGFAALMFNEGDRRKLRLELERGAVKDPTVTQPGDVVAFRQSRLG